MSFDSAFFLLIDVEVNGAWWLAANHLWPTAEKKTHKILPRLSLTGYSTLYYLASFKLVLMTPLSQSKKKKKRINTLFYTHAVCSRVQILISWTYFFGSSLRFMQSNSRFQHAISLWLLSIFIATILYEYSFYLKASCTCGNISA